MKKLLLSLCSICLASNAYAAAFEPPKQEPKPANYYTYAEISGLYSDVDLHQLTRENPPPFSMPITSESMSDNVFGGGIALGLGWKPHGISLRHDIEIAGRAAADDTVNPLVSVGNIQNNFHASLQATTIMFNTYYNFYDSERFQAYVSGGIGASHNHAKSTLNFTLIGFPPSTTISNNTTHFAWNAGAGMWFRVAKRVYIDLAYRYVDFGEVHWGDFPGGDFLGVALRSNHLNANEIKLGIVLRA